MINRKNNSLKDMSYTYFTVENINYNNIESEDLEKKQFLNDKINFEKNKFKEIEEILRDVFGEKNYKILYEQVNNSFFMKVIVKNINNSETFKLKVKISKEKFHIDFFKNEINTIIEIHRLNLF